MIAFYHPVVSPAPTDLVLLAQTAVVSLALHSAALPATLALAPAHGGAVAPLSTRVDAAQHRLHPEAGVNSYPGFVSPLAFRLANLTVFSRHPATPPARPPLMPSFASTRLVNPAGVQPILTVDHVWRGLQRKAREPKRFVPAISECRIDSEEGNKVRIRFSPFGGKRERGGQDARLGDRNPAY